MAHHLVQFSIPLLLVLGGRPALAQIEPGRFVVATNATASPTIGNLWAFEPLRGGVVPVSDPNRLLPRVSALAPTIDPDRWVVAIPRPGQTTIATLTLSGGQPTSLALLVSGIGEPVIWLHGDNAVGPLALTPSRLLSLRGGQTNTLAQAPNGTTFVGATFSANSLELLLRAASGTGSAGLLSYDPNSGAATTRNVALPGATCIAWSALRTGYYVGDRVGTLSFVDAQRLLVTPIANTGGGAITAIEPNSDQDDFLVTSGNRLLTFSGFGFVRSVSLPVNNAIAVARYAPYRSTTRRYGTACSTAGLQPRIGSAGRPIPGSRDFALLLTGSANASSGFLLLGLLPSAVPLDVIGLPGCVAWVDPLDALAARVNPLGTTRLPLPIPPEPNLVGASLYAQWLVLAPGTNRAGALTSDALRLLF